MCAARTLRDHLVDGGASLVRHETDDGENDEASKDTRTAVDHGHNQSVPETPSKCLFVFFYLPAHLTTVVMWVQETVFSCTTCEQF